MDDAKAADDIATALAAAAAAGTSHVTSVTADGITTAFSPKEARESLVFHERRASRRNNKRPMVRTLDLRGAH